MKNADVQILLARIKVSFLAQIGMEYIYYKINISLKNSKTSKFPKNWAICYMLFCKYRQYSIVYNKYSEFLPTLEYRQ